MTGIGGIVYPNAYQMNQSIGSMLDYWMCQKTQADSFIYKNIELGVCGSRLAYNQEKSLVAGFDGFIDNHLEILKDLKSHGVECNHDDHAQLVVHLYEIYGKTFLDRLTGAFAFFILDTTAKNILLARDRIGKKSLYWYQDQNHFLFATDIKALLRTGIVPQTIDLEGFNSYLYFGYVPQDMTAVKGINKLLPAYYLQYFENQSVSVDSYWSYSSFFEKRLPYKKKAVVEHLNYLLEESVKIQIPQDKPIGCFISGGLGSGAIAYYLNKYLPKEQLIGFSVGFEGQNEADLEAAKQVAESLGIEQAAHIIQKEHFLDHLVEIVWHLGEPIADPNVVATWKMAQIASSRTKTVFSGMGSDELLAGHSRYTLSEQPNSAFYRLRNEALPALSRFLIPLLKHVYKPLCYSLLKQARTNPWQFDYLRQNALFDEASLKSLNPKLASIFDPEVFLHKFHQLGRIKSNVASYMYFDVKTRLPDNYIFQYDRLTSAHGLLWKAPFLSRPLVEYLAGLNEPEVLGESDTAQFLKSILQDIYPENFIKRPKKTRRQFLSSWAEEPELHKAFQLLGKGRLVESGLITHEWLKAVLATPETRVANFRLLWAVLILEIWFRLFISNPIPHKVPSVSLITLLSEY